MKNGIHPTYYKDATITCSCGNVIKVGSTIQAYGTELCSKCHPFYTGKKKTVDTAGRIEKFKSMQKLALVAKEKVKNKKEKRRGSIEEKINQELQKQADVDRKKEEKLMSKIRKNRPQEEN
ncbi:MAG: 50S ribosomal protein L31, large subunit ribosomal protein L31 [Candidatus Peregrinibacteria bacterium GW2011_GWF2_39_17]|nr:MAG: 50S ribosomal protein L31, large subunit ribosomal protein L31 [Candidatus Peregrinibacteria bacterium GW2011_GWF2_39_17]HCW32006.1 50S ribosomal protein L31 [Candidatus Peregrinibacteria bacterium]